MTQEKDYEAVDESGNAPDVDGEPDEPEDQGDGPDVKNDPIPEDAL